MGKEKFKPEYRVIRKSPDNSAVIEIREFYLGELADSYAGMWPRSNVYLFKRGKLIRTVLSAEYN